MLVLLGSPSLQLVMTHHNQRWHLAVECDWYRRAAQGAVWEPAVQLKPGRIGVPMKVGMRGIGAGWHVHMRPLSRITPFYYRRVSRGLRA